MATRVTGQAKLKALSIRLDAAPRVMSAETVKALEKSAPKIMRSVDKSVAKRFPHRGGLAATMLRSMRYEARIRKTGMDFSAYALGKRGRRELPEMNRGRVKHPVFGNREVWRYTRIRPGAVSDPLRHEAPRIVKRELEKAINSTADFIEGK